MPLSFSPILEIVLRSAAVYAFMIVAFRVFGKRELSQLSIADLVLIVLISNAVQNAMVGNNTSLWGGLTAAGVLFVLNMLLGYLMFRFKKVRSLVEAEPVMLIYNGKVKNENLQKIMISEEELLAAVREHGIASFSEVKLSMLEVDGNISVVSGTDEHLKRTQHKRKRVHKTLQDF